MALSFPGLFDGVNDVDASSAIRRFEVRTLAAGDRVLRADKAGKAVVGLISGALEVRAGDVVVGSVGPGELVGELALFEAVRRTATVVAKAPSEVLVIPRTGYEELRDTAHPVAANIERVVMRQQAARLREMDERIALLSEGEPRAVRIPGQDFFARVTAEFGRGGMFDPVGVDPVAAWHASGLVSDLAEPVIEAMAKVFEVEVCGGGQILCTEGAPADRLWLIESGEVEVLVATENDGVQRLATVGPGSLLGAAALVDDGVRMASCVARNRLVALTLDAAGWAELEPDATLLGSSLRRAVIRALAAQLAGANAMLSTFEQVHADEALGEARSRLVASVSPSVA